MAHKAKIKLFGALSVVAIVATLLLWAQTVQYVYQFKYIATTSGASSGVRIVGSGAQYHQLSWNVTGTVSACSVRVDSSADGVTWNAGDVIAAQVCTSNGNALSAALTVNYVRINFTSFTGTGTVTATVYGYANNPSGGGSPTGAAGGDLGGTYPNPTVKSVANVNTGFLSAANNGVAVSSGANGASNGFWGGVDGGGVSYINITLVAGGAFPVANRVELYKFTLLKQQTVGTIAFGVNANAGDTVDFGIYSNDGTTKLLSIGGFVTAANTAQNRPIAGGGTVVLQPGDYWFAGCASGVTTTFNSYTNLATVANLVNTQTTKRRGSATNTCTAGVLPASTGAVTTGQTVGTGAAYFSH